MKSLSPALACFPDGKALLGLSGGRDSVVLLHLMLAAGRRDLIVCHLNHRLRGKDSDEDERFVRALAENALSLALVGRPLSSAEVLSGISEAVCFLTPFVFVTSTTGVSDISRADLISHYASDRPTWRTGAPVRVILRPVSDAATLFLNDLLPGMAEAMVHARTRKEIPVAASDQDNVELAASIADSLTGATLVQLLADSIPLTRLSLDGVPPTVEHMTQGDYPRGYKLCVARGRSPSDDALRLIAWMRKPGLEAFYASLGMARQ